MSKLFSLQLPDFIKGLLVAIVGAVLTTLEQVLTTGGFAAISWSAVALVGVNAGISYLVKNYFTNAQGAAFGMSSTITNDKVAP